MAEATVKVKSNVRAKPGNEQSTPRNQSQTVGKRHDGLNATTKDRFL